MEAALEALVYGEAGERSKAACQVNAGKVEEGEARGKTMGSVDEVTAGSLENCGVGPVIDGICPLEVQVLETRSPLLAVLRVGTCGN